MKNIMSLLLALGFFSCSTRLRDDPVAKNYQLGKLSNDWVEVKTKDSSKHFFQSSKHASVIGVSSICHRYQEATLKSLSKSLTRPMDNEIVIEQKEISMDQREALETRATGDVDGVPVEALFFVFRKNACVFDFSVVSKEKIPAGEEAEFREFVKAFRFEGSGQ